MRDASQVELRHLHWSSRCATLRGKSCATGDLDHLEETWAEALRSLRAVEGFVVSARARGGLRDAADGSGGPTCSCKGTERSDASLQSTLRA